MTPRLPLTQNYRQNGRPYWKATLRTAPPLSFALFGRWQDRVKVYRWKWLAGLAVKLHTFVRKKHLLKDGLVEPYVPGANVVRLSDRRSDD